MNIVDIIIIIIILIFIIRGYLKGFINEIFTLLIIVGSLIIAFILYRPFSIALSNILENPQLRTFVGFLVVFIIVAIFFVIIRNIFISILENLNLTDVDSLLGMIVGFLKGGLIVTLILMFFVYRNVLKTTEIIKNSFFFPYFEKAYGVLLSVLPEKISVIMNRFIGF